MNSDSPQTLAKEFGFWWTRGMNYEELIDRVQTVTIYDARRSCSRLFDCKAKSVVCISSPTVEFDQHNV